jgi:aquaporin Z
VALYVGDWAVAQLWLFWLAPIVGAVLGALMYRLIAQEEPAAVPDSVTPVKAA